MLTPEAAAALACLTTEGDVSAWEASWVGGDLPLLTREGDGVVLRGAAWKARLCPWRHRDPAEALEALEAAGLAPPNDERRAWWWPRCPVCRGGGEAVLPPRPLATAMLETAPCPACGGGGDGRASHPPDIAILASIAVLGPARWATAEELARVVERDATVVWRAMTAGDLRLHRERVAGPGGGDAGHSPLVRAFARAAANASARDLVLQMVPVPPAWDAMWRPPDVGDVDWRAMRDLYYRGVHPVGHGAGVVTLAVEALR